MPLFMSLEILHNYTGNICIYVHMLVLFFFAMFANYHRVTNVFFAEGERDFGRKKMGVLSFCLDFRMLNSRTSKDACFDDTVDTLVGSRYFSRLDQVTGRWKWRKLTKPRLPFRSAI